MSRQCTRLAKTWVGSSWREKIPRCQDNAQLPFFSCPSQKLLQFFLYVLKVVLCRKNGKLGLKRCACTGSRGTIFFPLSWHLVQQMGILQAKHWKMGSPHCALPHCASLLESAWSPRQIYIVVAPPVMPLPPQTGAVPVYRDTPGLSRCPKTDLEGFGTLRNRPGAPRWTGVPPVFGGRGAAREPSQKTHKGKPRRGNMTGRHNGKDTEREENNLKWEELCFR